MSFIINYFTFVFNQIIDILNTIKLSGSSSLLKYILVASILGFVFRLFKGSANEFNTGTQFLNNRIFTSSVHYSSLSHNNRKSQIVSSSISNSDSDPYNGLFPKSADYYVSMYNREQAKREISYFGHTLD